MSEGFEFLEFFGSIPAKTIGTGQSVLAFNIEDFRKMFDLSELRSMSRQSIVIRGLARKLSQDRIISSRLGGRSGVYMLCSDGDNHWNLLENFFKIVPDQQDELIRATPAKFCVGTPASMTGAQLAIETQSTGPCCVLFPSAFSIEQIVEEIRLDFILNSIDIAYLGLAFSAMDPTEKYPIGNPLSEVAFLSRISKMDDGIVQWIRQKLNQMLEFTGVLN